MKRYRLVPESSLGTAVSSSLEDPTTHSRSIKVPPPDVSDEQLPRIQSDPIAVAAVPLDHQGQEPIVIATRKRASKRLKKHPGGGGGTIETHPLPVKRSSKRSLKPRGKTSILELWLRQNHAAAGKGDSVRVFGQIFKIGEIVDAIRKKSDNREMAKIILALGIPKSFLDRYGYSPAIFTTKKRFKYE